MGLTEAAGVKLADVRVDLIEQLGDQTMLYASTQGGQALTIALDGQQHLQLGSTVTAYVDPSKYHAFGPDGRRAVSARHPRRSSTLQAAPPSRHRRGIPPRVAGELGLTPRLEFGVPSTPGRCGEGAGLSAGSRAGDWIAPRRSSA